MNNVERDLRDIKLFGMLSAISGALIMFLTALGVLMVLAAGGAGLNYDPFRGTFLVITLLIMSSALVGLGGDLQHSDRSWAGRENLRLDWTAMFLVLIPCFGIGLWLFQALAMFSAFMIVGCFWIRQPVIRVSSR